MILAYAAIFLIIIAVISGRDLSPIGQLQYRGGWVIAILIVILFIVQWTMVLQTSEQSIQRISLLILSQVILIGLFLFNHHLPGAKIFALGIALNTVAMVANGGLMPLSPETYQIVHPEQVLTAQTTVKGKSIILPAAETRLWILSDIIPLILPWRRSAISIGDILLIVGIAQFIFKTSNSKKALKVPIFKEG